LPRSPYGQDNTTSGAIYSQSYKETKPNNTSKWRATTITQEKINVRVELHGKIKQKADALREFYGTTSYTELFRILLTEKYREFPKEHQQ